MRSSSFTIPDGNFDAIIFDCDGTLVDSMPAHFEAWKQALTEHGAKGIFSEDVFYAMGGRPTTDIVTQLNGDYGLTLDPQSVADAKRRAFLTHLDEIELIEEVVAIARENRGKKPLGIATGGSRLVIEKTLQACGISDLFDEVVTANDVTNGKPDPEIFLKTAELLGVAPERCLVFEDAPPGVTAAEKAGMTVVLVPPPVSLV